MRAVLEPIRLGLVAAVTLAVPMALPGAAHAADTPVADTDRPAAVCPALLDRTFNRLQDEAPQSLCQYAGKVVLVVNTASYCGFTGQYKGLEALYAKYATQGLVVLGFPSNDFEQEPGSNEAIADFCFNTYGVKFPMFAKTSVKGKNANPFYLDLAAATGQRPEWNFYKYLIGRDGRAVASYASMVSPEDRRLVSEIERLLQAR